jgi:sodium transport system permease protein
MRPSMIGRVAAKEILSTLRDQRAIVSNLLIPLLVLPVMMLGLPLLMGGLFEREQATVTEIGVVGMEHLPSELRAAIEAQNVMLVPVDDVTVAVQDLEMPAALAVPEGFADRLAEGGSADVTIAAKVGNMRSELNAGKLQQAISAYQQGIVAGRLVAAGLDPAVLQPVRVVTVDASSEAERASGQLSWLIPFFIAIWTLTGGQMTAIDATAGEKERGTLEVLLVAPVRRIEIVVGKFIATMLFGLTAAIMAIVGYMVGALVMRSIFLPRLGEAGSEIVSVMGGSFDLSIGSIGMLLVSAILLSAVISALLIGIAMFARSFKEAQSYVAPLSFILILPAVALQFKDLIGLGDASYYIPIFNVLVLMDDVVRGAVSTDAVLLTWGSLTVAVVLLLAFALRNFQREDVIFRT